MQYTFNPITDWSVIHTGFYIALGVALFVVLVAGSIEYDMEIRYTNKWLDFSGTVWQRHEFFKTTKVIAVIMTIIFVLPSAYFSFRPDQYKPENRKVIATLVDEGERYEEYRESKKTKTRLAAHVTYMTPDGPVTFKKYDGMIYPEQIILYRNIRE